jgi:spermidine synthase
MMDLLSMVKSVFQTLCGLLFVIDCLLNGRISVTIMFGGFFSNILNFPFLVATAGLITLTCVFSATSVSIFTSILIWSELRNLLVDICAVLSPSFVEVWISASICLFLVVSVPVGLGFGLIIRGLSKLAKSINVPIMLFSCTVCVIACTWIGFFDSNGNQLLLISRTVQAYSPSIISTISVIQICYLLTTSNSRFQSVTLGLVLLIHTSYPGLKRQSITRFSRFELVDSSLSTSLVTVVNDRDLDVKIMRIDHSIVGGVFNEGLESVFETFYWYELVCHVPWMKSGPELSERHALVIGCGVGIVVDALTNRCKFDQVIVVDNNADVLNFASKYFALSENASLVTADGLEFIMAQDTNVFEFIVYDVFSGSFMHNNDIQELVSNCFRILSNNGILVLNLVSTVEMEVFHNIIQHLQSVFKHLKCFCEGGINSVNTGALVNFIFFASKSEEPLQFDMFNYRQNNGPNNYHAALETALRKLRSSEIQLTRSQNDEKINQRQIEWFVEKAHFESMRKLLPTSFWLYY